MQYQPDATALLDAVADLLTDEVIYSVPSELRHRVRVAAHLCRMVGREVGLAPDSDEQELERWSGLGFEETDLGAVRRAVAERLGDSAPLQDEAAVHAALLATVRADLAVSKPGYDA